MSYSYSVWYDGNKKTSPEQKLAEALYHFESKYRYRPLAVLGPPAVVGLAVGGMIVQEAETGQIIRPDHFWLRLKPTTSN